MLNVKTLNEEEEEEEEEEDVYDRMSVVGQFSCNEQVQHPWETLKKQTYSCFTAQGISHRRANPTDHVDLLTAPPCGRDGEAVSMACVNVPSQALAPISRLMARVWGNGDSVYDAKVPYMVSTVV